MSGKNSLTIPDEFTLSPLLMLLPVAGDATALETMKSSFFARSEKVNSLLEMRTQMNEEAARRVQAEAQMLKQVLDWLNRE